MENGKMAKRKFAKTDGFERFRGKRSEDLNSTRNFRLDSMVKNNIRLNFEGLMAKLRQKCKQFRGRHVFVSHAVAAGACQGLFVTSQSKAAYKFSLVCKDSLTIHYF